MAFHPRREGLPEIRFYQDNDGCRIGKDIFRVGAGYEIEPHSSHPPVLLLPLQKQSFLRVEGFRGGESDIRKTQLKGLVYHVTPAEHGLPPSFVWAGRVYYHQRVIS